MACQRATSSIGVSFQASSKHALSGWGGWGKHEKDLCGTVGYPGYPNQMLVLWCFGALAERSWPKRQAKRPGRFWNWKVLISSIRRSRAVSNLATWNDEITNCQISSVLISEHSKLEHVWHQRFWPHTISRSCPLSGFKILQVKWPFACPLPLRLCIWHFVPSIART